ncbi:hypothetical protein H072_4631 [Dactylellina haptotyla CBS 200.50]|uniref:Uncharacterized protein n=1 Tax=Dactylellina haptotyla (strain CBS 200.50) TaxID=1284197 RepID=S8BPU5_DACHA|nr:hypothetical protein H072_4631 [Dactylellina haptotyla CBS 200.50]
MGRYLPWRDDPGASGSRPVKRIKTEPRRDEEVVSKLLQQEDTFRDDEYMRDGLDNDDKYIMVEDELLQVAKSYTAKLHSAELARLREDQLARRKARLSASQSSQPKITGAMSKHRQVVLQRRAHDAALKKAAGVVPVPKEEEPYNPQFSSQSLGRLMTATTPRLDSSLPLPPLPGKSIKPATRAAAGFTKASFKKPSSTQASPSQLRRTTSQAADDDDEDDEESDEEEYSLDDDDDDDDDDLDLVPKRRPPSSRRQLQPAFIERKPPEEVNSRISLSKHPPTSSPASRIVTGAVRPSVKTQLPSSPTPQPVNKPYDPLRPPTKATSSGTKPSPSPAPSKSKPKLALSDSESDDYADAEQAERWRRRKEHAGAQRSGAKS